VEAARGLPLGVVNKMYLGFEERDVPAGDGNLSRASPSIAHGSYDLRPLGRPLIEAFLAGPLAADLERAGPGAAAAFVIDELVELLGASVRGKLRPLALSAWAGDSLSGGSYSYALPGCAEARGALAAPATERIFIAGEAAAPAYFGTVHGAGETGVIAAERALGAIGAVTTRAG
jgi:monoamine oxidase